jgi:hypothetical protein
MKKTILYSLTLFALCFIFSANIMDDNGKAGATGAPGENTCNTTNCHNSFALNSGGGTLTASCTMNNWKYEPLTIYDITIKVARTGNHLFGFAAEILTTSNTNAGTIAVSDAVHTTIKTATISGVGRRAITHKLNGGAFQDSATFTFRWTSPDTTTGPITMYFAGNATNANGQPTGDYIYTATQLITPETGLGVKNLVQTNGFNVFPNPVHSDFNVHYVLQKNEVVSIKLYDIKGSKTYELLNAEKAAGEHNDLLSIPAGCKTGTYLLSIVSNTGHASSRIIVDKD